MTDMTFAQALTQRARLLAGADAHLVHGDTPEKLAATAAQIVSHHLLVSCLERLGLLVECASGSGGPKGDAAFAFGIIVTLSVSRALKGDNIDLPWRDAVIACGELFYMGMTDGAARSERIQEGFRLAQQVLAQDPAIAKWRESVSTLVMAYVCAAVRDVGMPEERILDLLANHMAPSLGAASVDGRT